MNYYPMAGHENYSNWFYTPTQMSFFVMFFMQMSAFIIEIEYFETKEFLHKNIFTETVINFYTMKTKSWRDFKVLRAFGNKAEYSSTKQNDFGSRKRRFK